MKLFGESLRGSEPFLITTELVPGRGYKNKSVDSLLSFVGKSAQSGRIHAVSLTDNAGGNPALSADVLGGEILTMGMDIIVHFTCKDMNRNFIESRAFALQRMGVGNLLVMTGDYPLPGFQGLGKPVFDMDSVNALRYLKEMNRGLYLWLGKKEKILEKTNFTLGAVVSPFKWTEALTVTQYQKLEKKWYAGADYFITQIGFDARKLRELTVFVRETLRSDLPLLGSVYLLTLPAARIMNGGHIPGCYVDDRLLKHLEAEAGKADKGKDAALRRAGKQLAVLRGLGYRGAHLEGPGLKWEEVEAILGYGDEFAGNWQAHAEEFMYSPAKPYYLFDKTPRPAVRSPFFWMTRIIHHLLFREKTLPYVFMRSFAVYLTRHRFFYRIFTLFERMVKRSMFECTECGDCALFDTYYVCPESKCPKGMRIGPCGGTRTDDTCEVFPDKMCIWHTIYIRAKRLSEVDRLRYIIPPRDWKLYKTNSWVNYFLGEDHAQLKVCLPPSEELGERIRDIDIFPEEE